MILPWFDSHELALPAMHSASSLHLRTSRRSDLAPASLLVRHLHKDLMFVVRNLAVWAKFIASQFRQRLNYTAAATLFLSHKATRCD